MCFAATLLALTAASAPAGNVTLAWDPVIDAGLRGYIVYYTAVTGTNSPPLGLNAAAYDTGIDVGNTTTYTVQDLLDGIRYRFAVSAYDGERVESDYSNEVSAIVPFAALVADFDASTRTGAAPLAMNFINTSVGAVATSAWTFGDGGTSNVQHPSHVYTIPGVYTVRLSVTGPDGSSAKTVEGCVVVSPPAVGKPLPKGPS